MRKSLFHHFRTAWSGLPGESWLLALVVLINRSGAMVIPFLSVYLTRKLGFSLTEAGWSLAAFGLGAMAGAYSGGRLTDRFGAFRIQAVSLTLTGVMFFILMTLTSFYPVTAGIFILSLVAEAFRPANAVSVAHWSPPDKLTRAFSLNRMAANLGFGIGPAIGGFLAVYGFHWLFIADGATCIAAAGVFYRAFRDRNSGLKSLNPQEKASAVSAWKDPWMLGIVFLVSLNAISFFQFFTTLPVFYRTEYHLPENQIGMLLAFNGLLVFVFEMVLVNVLEGRVQAGILVTSGAVLLGLSWLGLAFLSGIAVLVGAMVLLSFSEMLAMPFLASSISRRAAGARLGEYMAMYTMAYSLAHVAAPVAGTQIADMAGFSVLWLVSGLAALGVAAGFWMLLRSR